MKISVPRKLVRGLHLAMVISLTTGLVLSASSARGAGFPGNTTVALANATTGQASAETISFVAASAVAAGGVIKLTYPVDFDVTNAVLTSINIGGNPGTAALTIDKTTDPAQHVIFVTLTGATSVAASAAVVIVINGVRNSFYEGALPALKIQTFASATAAAETDSGFGGITDLVAASMTSVQVSVFPGSPGATSVATIDFVTVNPIDVNDKIVIVFPAGFGVANATVAARRASAAPSPFRLMG